MPTTQTKNRLARLLDHGIHAGQRFRGIHLPGMTLSAENYVRRTKTANSLERNLMEWLDKNFEFRDQTTKHRANLARACALTINCVVDQIDEQVTSNYKASH